jgi:hypothetical protein
MSSNSNHINPIITLDNYEEYFILYMDNELDQHQVKMVEAFLHAHPHLQIELDMLMETKLPVETISFDKFFLLSSNMPSHVVEEDLLLFMDNELNELDPSRQKVVQLELDSNPEYQENYRQLLLSKLDPSEHVIHPNKKELYRHETKVIGFAVWMRIAAALILIAALSVLYFMSGNKENITPGFANKTEKVQPKEINQVEKVNISNQPSTELAVNKTEEKETVDKNVSKKISGSSLTKSQEEDKELQQLTLNNTINQDDPNEARTTVMERTVAIETSKQSFNNKLVTVDHVEPYNNITASIQPAVYVENAAGNNDHKKGSLKSFFRKATRIVGQTTGFNASNNDDNEVLIGAVAIKL